jgi:hypothetical protein
MMIKDDILKVVCDRLNIDIKTVLQDNHVSGARKKELVQARGWAMYFMRENTPYSGDTLDAIGNYFHRDHASVLYTIRKIEESLSVYSDMRILRSEIKLDLLKFQITEAKQILADINAQIMKSKTTLHGQLEAEYYTFIERAKQITMQWDKTHHDDLLDGE